MLDHFVLSSASRNDRFTSTLLSWWLEMDRMKDDDINFFKEADRE